MIKRTNKRKADNDFAAATRVTCRSNAVPVTIMLAAYDKEELVQAECKHLICPHALRRNFITALVMSQWIRFDGPLKGTGSMEPIKPLRSG